VDHPFSPHPPPYTWLCVQGIRNKYSSHESCFFIPCVCLYMNVYLLWAESPQGKLTVSSSMYKNVWQVLPQHVLHT
jgi:hypothetical protein